MTSHRLRLGTRASALARWQANWVAERLQAQGLEVELVPISTSGDRQQVGPIGAIGVEGVFTKELQRALLANEIDLAVHSLKDLPTQGVPGLMLGAVPVRGPVADVLISKSGARFADLPRGATIGTGSARRRSQLWHVRRDVNMAELRGNIDTRLAKLKEGQYDAIVLAEAGLRRLNLAESVTEVLSTDFMLPAVGQGALGIEVRADDRATRGLLASLDDLATHAAVVAERTMLARLLGGCLAPVAGWARLHDPARLRLTGAVYSIDGQTKLHAEATFPLIDAAALGAHVADDLLGQGAEEVIRAAREAL